MRRSNGLRGESGTLNRIKDSGTTNSVDRAKALYERLGWRLGADFANSDDFRVIQIYAAWLRVLGHRWQERHRGGSQLRPGLAPDHLRHAGA